VILRVMMWVVMVTRLVVLMLLGSKMVSRLPRLWFKLKLFLLKWLLLLRLLKGLLLFLLLLLLFLVKRLLLLLALLKCLQLLLYL